MSEVDAVMELFLGEVTFLLLIVQNPSIVATSGKLIDAQLLIQLSFTIQLVLVASISHFFLARDNVLC